VSSTANRAEKLRVPGELVVAPCRRDLEQHPGQTTGLTLRTVDDLKIEGVIFSTFFGGGDQSWATPRDQYADFAVFAVSGGYIGALSGPAPSPAAVTG